MSEQIQFLEYQKPALESGEYQIAVEQSVHTGAEEETFTSKPFRFSVLGERFSLNPDAVHAVFPPAGSLGRRTDVLPHISINRSTFPWERSAYGNEDYEPWLALLLFDEQEISDGEIKKQIITLGELKESTGVKFPNITLETGQSDDDKVTVIDVKKSLLRAIIPTGDELKLLAHVRRRVSSNENDSETELATMMCNRLPRGGANSTMHLVSVERRYRGSNKLFNYQSAAPNGYIRLVSLKSWSFACLPEGKDFEELVDNLGQGMLRIPNANSENTAETYLAKGYVPLPHKLRRAAKTYSWYRSPLATDGTETSKFNSDDHLPRFADALVRYHKDIGMFDHTYSAAFELGRVLALEDNLFSTALYQWKNQYNEKISLQQEQAAAGEVVTSVTDEGQENILEQKITIWFKEKALLRDIPFKYLLPDEKMLPPESIRFFQINTHWIECLLYGAFSIGTQLRSDEVGQFKALTQEIYNKARSGFILRSQLVPCYPDMIVDAYNDKINNTNALPETGLTKLAGIRTDYLGPDVLLCLYEGDIKTLELYLKPEGLRFGLDEESGGYSKDIHTDSKTTIDLPELIKEGEKRVVKITNTNGEGIADKIDAELNLGGGITAAQFGMHMLEGSSKGRFVINTSDT